MSWPERHYTQPDIEPLRQLSFQVKTFGNMRHFEFAYKELVEFSNSGEDTNKHQAVEFIR